jgi:two-component system sensor histidine kinase QseC
MNPSLRVRLLVATSASTAVVLSLLGVAIYATMRHLLLSDYDASLLTKARAIAAAAEQKDGRVKIEFDPKQMPEFWAREHPEYFQVWSDDGKVLERSESLRSGELPNTMAGARATAGALALPGTARGRSVVVSFTPRREGERPSRGGPSAPLRSCTIAVAGTPVEAERTLGHLGWLLLASCGTAIAVSGGVLMSVVRHALRPVEALARVIEGVRETDLTVRLPPRRVPVELSPIVETLNGLLDRLDAAFAREKAFTADVAHELRTPLAGLLATLEVCRSRRRDPAAYEAAIDECQEMTDNMQGMVENLLLLARADAGQLPVACQPVDVRALMLESWSLFEVRAAARQLDVQWVADTRGDACTDPDKLRIIIQNLFDNAVSYADEGGRLRVAVTVHDRDLRIEVANTGCDVAAADVAHLFDRFWRKDQGRSDTGVHCGLGLSLSQRLTGLLGGRISVESDFGGEFIARLELPSGVEGRPAPERADLPPAVASSGA